MCQSIRQCSAKSVKRFERSNGLDTALYKNYLYLFLPLPYGKHPAVRVLVSPDGHVTSPRLKCNERLHSFGSLHDGSYLGIGKDATIEVVWGRPFPFREAKSPWVEWLQCSCSLTCSCSNKHRVLSHD